MANDIEVTKEQLDQEKFKDIILRDINFSIQSGKFIGIIGKVGSGKSTLLNAIIGELYSINSAQQDFQVNKSLAYCGGHQQFIESATIRDNILFDKPLNQEWYQKVLQICALGPDLKMFPSGDMTSIGEKGINLSGGQKARISLARAVYSQHQVLLLDDPISSLDIFSAQQVLNECLLGELKNKTRILVTHHLDILPFVDEIYVMDKGFIVERGTYEKLNLDLNSFYKQHLSTSENLTRFSATQKQESEKVKMEENKKEKLEEDEDRCFGQVKSILYQKYLNYTVSFIIVIFLMMVLICLLMSKGLDIHLHFWIDNKNDIDASTAIWIFVFLKLGF